MARFLILHLHENSPKVEKYSGWGREGAADPSLTPLPLYSYD